MHLKLLFGVHANSFLTAYDRSLIMCVSLSRYIHKKRGSMPKKIDFNYVSSCLRAYYQKEGRLPSFAEFGVVCGYRSKGAVSRVVNHLVAKGIVRKDHTGRLIPTALLKGGLRLLGAVQAGFPSPAEEELIDVISLDEFLIGNPEASYLVRVTGDSMIDAGIHPGDLIIVERGCQPKSGDIVVAQVDGEWTLKYYRMRGKQVILCPANDAYEPIVPKEELLVGGVVTACVRKYGTA